MNRTEHKRRVLKTNLSKEEEEQRTEPKKPSFKLSESPTFKKRADVVPEVKPLSPISVIVTIKSFAIPIFLSYFCLLFQINIFLGVTRYL